MSVQLVTASGEPAAQCQHTEVVGLPGVAATDVWPPSCVGAGTAVWPPAPTSAAHVRLFQTFGFEVPGDVVGETTSIDRPFYLRATGEGGVAPTVHPAVRQFCRQTLPGADHASSAVCVDHVANATTRALAAAAVSKARAAAFILEQRSRANAVRLVVGDLASGQPGAPSDQHPWLSLDSNVLNVVAPSSYRGLGLHQPSASHVVAEHGKAKCAAVWVF